MRKQLHSKLDGYSSDILRLTDEHRTLEDVRAWLAERGVSASLSWLSKYCSRLEDRRREEALLEMIANGGRMNKELDQAYKHNPPPDIGRLIQITQTLVASLQIRGAADPRLLALSNSMQQTVLHYVADCQKRDLKDRELDIQERRVSLLEKKAADYDRAREVAQAILSPAEKEARYRQIFGLTS